MYDKFSDFSGIRYFIEDFFFHIGNKRGFQANSSEMCILNVFVFLLTICAIILKNANMLSKVPRDTDAHARQTVPGLKS